MYADRKKTFDWVLSKRLEIAILDNNIICVAITNNWRVWMLSSSSSSFYIYRPCQPWHDRHEFPRKRGWDIWQKFFHLHRKAKEMWLNMTLNNTECWHQCLLAGNWSKIYTGYTSFHNFMFARLVEHVEFMEHGEPIVKPNITGLICCNNNVV